MVWDDKIQVKKGNIGEKIFDEIAKKLGYIIYKPEANKGHGFDRLVTDRKKYFLAEIKTKAMREYYPDTGFDYIKFIEYKKQCDRLSLPMVIFFVDEKKGQIYGDFLHNLTKKISIKWKGKEIEYPLIEKRKRTIIYFYQPHMKIMAYITDNQISSIIKHSTRKYPLQTELKFHLKQIIK